MSLSPPQIALPTYSRGKAVVVSGYLAGAEITIFRYPAAGGSSQEIGHGKAPMVELMNIEVDQLQYNDRVFAIQKFCTDILCLTSLQPSKIPQTGLPPVPLPAPYIRTPLYACAGTILVVYHSDYEG